MYSILKKPVKNLLHNLGWDLVRFPTNPKNTLLGFCNLPIRTILDIGANTGQSARHYRVLFPDATIYCFEPLPDAYCELERWAQSQGEAIKPINVALGKENGTGTMFFHLDHSPSSSQLPSTPVACQLYPQISRQRLITVTQQRLDDLEKNLNLDKEILIKIDTQGTEDAIIKGGKHVIEQAIGCIVEISLQPIYEGQPSFADMTLTMLRLGFAYAGNLMQSYDQDGRVVFIDAVFENRALRSMYDKKYSGEVYGVNSK